MDTDSLVFPNEDEKPKAPSHNPSMWDIKEHTTIRKELGMEFPMVVCSQ